MFKTIFYYETLFNVSRTNNCNFSMSAVCTAHLQAFFIITHLGRGIRADFYNAR